MTTPTAVLNTLIAERMKIRAQTGRRAVTPPPAATVSSALPSQAIGQRAEFSAFGPATLPLGLRVQVAAGAFLASQQPTLSRNWVSSRSSSSTQLNGPKHYVTQIGGPSSKPSAVDASAGGSATPPWTMNTATTNAVPASGGLAGFPDPNGGAGGNAGLFAGY